jgi:quercetin dioxygenase-like cupin family protein
MIDTRKIDFNAMPWEHKKPGMRSKELRVGSQRIRLLEISPEYRDEDWCEHQHTGYIIEGRITFIYEDGQIEYRQGDALLLGLNRSHRHKAFVSPGEKALLIVVEPN